MRFMSQKQSLIRHYLLGTLDERMQQLIEKRILTDRRFRKRVLLIEDELFDDYVLGTLSSDERQRFDRRLLGTAEQVNKLETIRAYKNCATSMAGLSLPTDTHGRQSSLSRWLRGLSHWRSMMYVSAAMVVLITLVGMAALVVQRLNKPAGDARHEREAVEEQLARLNARQGIADPSSALSVALAPTAVRKVEPNFPIKLSAGTDLIQFELQLLGGGHQSFEATMQTPEGVEMFTVRGLHATSERGDEVVRLKVPAWLLPDGDYLLKLRGVSAEGRTDVVGEYFFRTQRAGPDGK
jgi:anti-sigma-K factor RskA